MPSLVPGLGILRGLAETARNFFGSYFYKDRLTTVQYPEEREKILRKLSGIKEVPKKKEKEKKPPKSGDKAHATAEAPKQAHGSAAGKAAIKAQHKDRVAAGKQAGKAVPPASHGKAAVGSKKSTGRK